MSAGDDRRRGHAKPGSPRPEELSGLRNALAAGGPVACPSCGSRMDVRSVPPRNDVSYVRWRAWLVCPSCGNSLTLDVEHGG